MKLWLGAIAVGVSVLPVLRGGATTPGNTDGGPKFTDVWISPADLVKRQVTGARGRRPPLTIDVTELLRKNGEKPLTVKYSTMGGDPAGGRAKSFWVAYRIKGEVKTFSCREYSEWRLPKDAVVVEGFFGIVPKDMKPSPERLAEKILPELPPPPDYGWNAQGGFYAWRKLKARFTKPDKTIDICEADAEPVSVMLTDWKTVNTASEVVCETRIRKTEAMKSAPGLLLDLGDVFYTTSVKVNGRKFPESRTTPFRYDITDACRDRDEIAIEVRVANQPKDLLFPAYAPLESGVVGPAKIVMGVPLVKVRETRAMKKLDEITYRQDDYRNYYGSWSELSPHDGLLYARNMGYRYVLYRDGMEKDCLSDGMYFVFETPEYDTYDRTLDTRKRYSAEQIALWQDICAKKDGSKPFPENMATGWFWDQHASMMAGDKRMGFKSFSLQLNFQKKSVIDRTVAKIIARAEAIMKVNPRFKFGGCSWDVPDLSGDFYGFPSEDALRPVQCTLSHWTGRDSSSPAPGETFDYETYREGTIRYRMALRAAGRKLNPELKFYGDPYMIYTVWIRPLEKYGFDRPEFRDGWCDLLMQESRGTDLVTDARTFASGLTDPAHVALSCDESGYRYENEISDVGNTAAAGSWAAWFGCPCPLIGTIRDVPARLKLTRALPTWENLNNTRISSRRFIGGVYSSPTAHLDAKCVWATHPVRKEIFFCMTAADGEVVLPEGYKVGKITALTSVMGEYPWPRLENNFAIDNGRIRIKAGSEYVVGEAFAIKRAK